MDDGPGVDNNTVVRGARGGRRPVRTKAVMFGATSLPASRTPIFSP